MQDKHNTSDTNNASLNRNAFSFEDLATLESSPYTQYRHMYVDICDDLIAGILLSKIVYWFGIGRNGEQRARHEHDGKVCIVKKREDWWEECRIGERQYDRAMAKLIELGIISTEIHYNPFIRKTAQRATFIFINKDVLIEKVSSYLKDLEERNFRNNETVISETDESVISEPTISGHLYRPMNTSMNTSQSERRALEISVPKKEKKQTKSPKPEKIAFRENVLLTQEEHDKLLSELGSDQFNWMLDELNCKKASNGYEYDCDAATMWKNGWVRKAWNDHISKPQINRSGSAHSAGNEELSKNALRDYVSHYYKIDVLYDRIEFIPNSGSVQPDTLRYSEQEGAFASQLNGLLNKRGFIKRVK